MAEHVNSEKGDGEAMLDEIISHAVGLPVENQDLLLAVAKAMRYTHDCSGQYIAGLPSAK